MFSESINLLGVLAVSLIVFFIGWIWYGLLFKKQWIKLSKISALDIAKIKEKTVIKTIFNFIGTFIMVFVFANIINFIGVLSSGQGALLGFWIWLGFFASTTLLEAVLWGNKSRDFFVLYGLYWLIVLMVSGALLVAWI